MKFKTLDDFDFNGKTVFVRADLNVPAKEGVITDMTRIDRFVPTLKEIVNKGGKVVIASHFGRPKGEKKPEFSMAFMVPAIEKASGLKVQFIDDCIGEKRDEAIRAMKQGDVILLENLRFYSGEEKNDKEFAEQLASGIDIYINDAFSTAHRAHASTEGMAHLLPRGAGRLMQEELEALDKALGNPVRPAVAIVGGSKVSTKLDLLSNLVKKVDYLCIGGGMAHTFMAAQGIVMGEGSLVEQMVRLDGKSACTHYQTLRQVGPHCLVQLLLETGRTHQIRVHMAYLGHPLVGDFLYGTELDDLPGRFALHSALVRLRHPVTGEWIERESPLPSELSALMDRD